MINGTPRPTRAAKAFLAFFDIVDAVARAGRAFITSTRGAWALAMQYRDANREFREAMLRREEMLKEKARGDWPYSGGLGN